MGVLSKLFGAKPVTPNEQPGEFGLYGINGPTGPGTMPPYHFNPVGIKLPGQAYHMPLLQFQSWANSMVQGRGTLVVRSFAPYEPQTATQTNTPINSQSAAILSGQFFSQPLVNTAQSVGNVG